jgi:hypothetical protein
LEAHEGDPSFLHEEDRLCYEGKLVAVGGRVLRERRMPIKGIPTDISFSMFDRRGTHERCSTGGVRVPHCVDTEKPSDLATGGLSAVTTGGLLVSLA